MGARFATGIEDLFRGESMMHFILSMAVFCLLNISNSYAAAPSRLKALAISSVGVSNISSKSAQINYQTNLLSNGYVQFGISTGYGQQTPLELTAVKSHAAVIGGLSANTLYHFKIIAHTSDGRSAASADYTFATPADVAAPVTLSCASGLIQYRDICVAPISTVPASVGTAYGLSPFYTKYTSMGGMPVLSSGQVPDQALFEESYVIYHITQFKPGLLNVLNQNKIRVAAMSIYEVTTNIPEHSDLTPKDYWDTRARGLGATLYRPATSGAEENLLCYTNDVYRGESIFLHEFSHSIYLAIRLSDSVLRDRILAAYQNALAKGLWANTYAITNDDEYFAEVSQSWFDNNIVGPVGGNGVHNNIATRSLVKTYDPTMASIMMDVYGDSSWRMKCK